MGLAQNHPLESAATYIRRLYETGAGDEEGGWFDRLQFEEDQLRNWAEANGFLGGEHELIPASPADGVEHRVLLDKARSLVIKATHPETYGGAPQISYDADELTGRPIQRLVMGKATPLQYLERWLLSNIVFADDVRLERVLSIGYGLSIVVSQPDIQGTAPTLEDISAFFTGIGFIELPHSTNAWYRPFDDIVAIDAHQANLVQTQHGLVPIDVPLFRPDRDIRSWLKRTAKITA